MDNLFIKGAEWCRADFHLHTNADKEFTYACDVNYYNSAYIDALLTAEIRVGIITNHNKFDYKEYKELRNTAKKKGIFLLPGVELSVNDGANGIHLLIVFAETWLENNSDKISSFLTAMFLGKTPAEYQNENARCDKNILQIVEEIQKVGLDYFLVFAHVEDNKGLWAEMKGGKLSDLTKDSYAEVRKHVLAFQKVRTNDERVKIKQALGNWYPAEVEGSDPKQISEIGKGKPCFLKLGAFTFEAIKLALCDFKNRVTLNEKPSYSHSHIKNISFSGGVLNNKTIHFSPELNTLIGIRGSGKSSILEVLRYVLDIRLDDADNDSEYKRRLVHWTLGSGGKVLIDAVDRHGQSYQISRILNEQPNIMFNGELRSSISISETILHKPLFFGQKELAIAGKGSEKELIEKLIGTKCDEVRRKIHEQKSVVIELIGRLSKNKSLAEEQEEQVKRKKDIEHQLEFYKRHKLEEKFQKRLAFDADIRHAKAGISLLELFITDLRELLAKHEDDLRNFTGYISNENLEFFKNFDKIFFKVVQSIDTINNEFTLTQEVLKKLVAEYSQLIERRNNLTEEFAAIERHFAEELKTMGEQNISSDEFLKLTKNLTSINTMLASLNKSQDNENNLQNDLNIELQRLNNLWHEEFSIIKTELEAVSQKNTALQFCVGFKEDKKAFLEYFKSICKGSGVRELICSAIVDKYSDFCAVYNDLENAKTIFGSNPEKLIEIISKNQSSLLTYQTPNKFTITYRNAQLAHHSLGQRASALILFVLGQEDNDVIIIDQPEDDLDNQTIYEDVIKLLRKLKPKIQFIFATHNPNIPVLGDAEQVHVCLLEDHNISLKSGALDNPEQQKKIINIMEGGEEAFKRRKEIYNIWNP